MSWLWTRAVTCQGRHGSRGWSRGSGPALLAADIDFLYPNFWTEFLQLENWKLEYFPYSVYFYRYCLFLKYFNTSVSISSDLTALLRVGPLPAKKSRLDPPLPMPTKAARVHSRTLKKYLYTRTSQVLFLPKSMFHSTLIVLSLGLSERMYSWALAKAI
jgi:hypothetical protein